MYKMGKMKSYLFCCIEIRFHHLLYIRNVWNCRYSVYCVILISIKLSSCSKQFLHCRRFLSVPIFLAYFFKAWEWCLKSIWLIWHNFKRITVYHPNLSLTICSITNVYILVISCQISQRKITFAAWPFNVI